MATLNECEEAVVPRCHCGKITGVRCEEAPVGLRTIHYLPKWREGTARTLSSSRGLLESVEVCKECFGGHLVDYYDEDLMGFVAAV